MVSTFLKITGLALADSVNPCAIAVLLLVLVVILAQDPKKRYKVLLGGISFISAVYIGYIFYGYILINIWQAAAESLRVASTYIYKIFGVLAMILGALQIKDFFYYRKGSFATEMPMVMRPKVQKIINKITSPSGAFIGGLLVTLFLLPCTIGPYIVATGILSELSLLKVIPWILYYNLLFVLPMMIIVIMVYAGLKTIRDIEYWKKKNTRRLHLIAGILLFGVGLSLIMSWL